MVHTEYIGARMCYRAEQRARRRKHALTIMRNVCGVAAFVFFMLVFGKAGASDCGKVICHICGRSYNRLGSHIRESHSMTIEEYKAEFGLCSRTKTTEKSYSQTMRENAYKYDMDKRLLEAGKSTRIKKGETDKRKNKKVRLQEVLEKRNRGKKEN